VAEQERVLYLVEKLAISGSFKGVNQDAITQIIQSMSSELSDLKSVPDSSLVDRALEHIAAMKSTRSGRGSAFMENLVTAPPSPKEPSIMRQLNLPEFEEKDLETLDLDSQSHHDLKESPREHSGQHF